MNQINGHKQQNNGKWLLLTTLVLSYPLVALFGASDGSVSLTALPTIVALAIGGLVAIAKSENSYNFSVLMIAAAAFALNAVVLATDPPDVAQKFWIFNGVFLAFGFVLALNLGVPLIVENMERALMILGGIALFLLFTDISEYDTGRLTFGDNNPIWMGRLFGMACVATTYAALTGRFHRGLSVVLLLALFIGMILTGSRGPVFAYLFAAVTAFMLSYIKRKYTFGAIISLVILIGALLLEITGRVDFRGLSFGEADDVSYFIRLNMFDYTFAVISTYSTGIGIGNFSFMNFDYPHNILLEFLAEWGWYAGGAYIALLIFGGIGLFIGGVQLRFLLLLFLFEFVNSCFSGDITSPRLLYALSIAGCALLLSRNARIALAQSLASASYRSPQPSSGFFRADVDPTLLRTEVAVRFTGKPTL